jgi:GTP pyrophosphokinase
VINNGDRIEIMTSQNSKGPSRDWLNIVKSTQARNKINQWFKSEFKVENIVRGKELLTHYCRTRGINIHELTRPEYMDSLMKKYGFHDWDSVLAAVGHGGLKEGQIINKLAEAAERNHKNNLTDDEILHNIIEGAGTGRTARAHSKSGIIVKGIDDVAVRFSKCCLPLPGDEIIGFVTRGRGVSIHRTDCVNMLHLPEGERERLIDAEWQSSEDDLIEEKYLADIKIFAENRNGLLADISRIMAERKIDITALTTRINKQGMAIMTMSFEVGNREELVHISDKIRAIESVIDIERTTG